MSTLERSVRTHTEFLSHFWTAADEKYLHFGWPFDASKSPLLLEGGILPALGSPERHALELCLLDALLCMERFAAEILREQTSFHAEEERRHSEAVANYRQVRFPGAPWSSRKTIAFCNRVLRTSSDDQLAEILEFGVEPLATALAGLLHARGTDPLLVRMCSFIIADEMAHEPDHSRLPDSKIGRKLSKLLQAFLTDCAKASTLPPTVIGPFVFEYAPQALLQMLPISELQTKFGARQQGNRAMLKRIAVDATDFLTLLSAESNPVPPKALAIEWMAAGLRSSASLL